MVEDPATRITLCINTDMNIIPGGLNKLVQSADVSWNKAFKTTCKDKYTQWMASGQKSFRPRGDMCAPNKAHLLKWVKQCWSSLSTELIQKSFCSCGIFMNVDSSEASAIHCLKAGEIATLAAPTITDVA